MIALLELVPRWVLLALLAGAVALSGAQTVRLAGARADVAAERQVAADLRASIAEANTQAAETAAENYRLSLKAQNEAHQREEGLRAAADRARRESDGLRNDADSLRLQLEAGTRAAAIDRAVAVGAVLSQCGARYQVLAQRCDRHVNDLQTLIEAWPK